VLVHRSVICIAAVALMLLTPGPLIEWLKTLLSLPVMPPSETEFPTDKLVHCLLFAGCTFFCLQDWREKFGLFMVLLMMLAFAALTELLQIVIPGRSGDWSDFAADALGIAGGFWWYVRIKKARFAKTGL
jgi:VanZ family protein